MPKEEKSSTKEKILSAAQEIFIEKGKDGARMQEIADRANVNKAMLFYYYNNKNFLYNEVLKTNVSQIFTLIKKIIISGEDPRQIIEQFVNAYINFISEHPELPKLILREIASGGDNIKNVLKELKEQIPFGMPSPFLSMINKSIKQDQFRKIDPTQTVISIISMCILYFIGKPLIQTIFDIQDSDEKQFLEERKKSIIDLLEHGILKEWGW